MVSMDAGVHNILYKVLNGKQRRNIILQRDLKRMIPFLSTSLLCVLKHWYRIYKKSREREIKVNMIVFSSIICKMIFFFYFPNTKTIIRLFWRKKKTMNLCLVNKLTLENNYYILVLGLMKLRETKCMAF